MPRKKDPLVPLPMRLPKSMMDRLDRAAAAWGASTTRTDVTKRLINDGFKWWAREDLEQDTTLQMVAQTHERVATILAILNVMVDSLDLTKKDPDFREKVSRAKADILAERKRDAGPDHDLGEPGDDDDDDDPGGGEE